MHPINKFLKRLAACHPHALIFCLPRVEEFSKLGNSAWASLNALLTPNMSWERFTSVVNHVLAHPNNNEWRIQRMI